ncbi:MAG TPA: hypothetical protein VM008_22540, partial [Phycisphaerae bacterium]|nr:hypothetical protein [Phycisphaerae bacterium]
RETTLCLGASRRQCYHCGLRGAVAKGSLADANESRDYRIFRDVALCMIASARRDLPVDPGLQTLEAEIYALDATTIDLCLKLFPWARFRRRKAAVKLHMLVDLRVQIPCLSRFPMASTTRSIPSTHSIFSPYRILFSTKAISILADFTACIRPVAFSSPAPKGP